MILFVDYHVFKLYKVLTHSNCLFLYVNDVNWIPTNIKIKKKNERLKRIHEYFSYNIFKPGDS